VLAGTRCVVTGGLGFIGSSIVARLVDAGADVSVVDALVSGHGGDRRNLAGLGIPVLEANIGAPEVAEALDGAELIFNVAGQVSHTASMVDPRRDLELNALDHSAFLETVRRVCPHARIVHASTRQVYGRPVRTPVDEHHPANPMDVNGVAKLAGEQLHLVHHRAYGMATTSLRLTNVYGPRQRLTSDELGFLPVFVRRAMLGEAIRLFGDGSQRRDCLYIDDVVDAFVAATADAAIGKVYNVGHPCDHSLREIADLVVKEAGMGSDVVLTPWPEDHQRIDIGSFRSDSTLIRDELGWSAGIDIVDGLRRTVDFLREHPWYLSSI
jgi:UDP-glucose 4-epimerase